MTTPAVLTTDATLLPGPRGNSNYGAWAGQIWKQKMTVAELIAKLQRQDPATVVVLRGGVDYDAIALTCEELRPGAVQAVQLKRLPAREGGWDPLGGTKLYELLNTDEAAAVQGVLLG